MITGDNEPRRRHVISVRISDDEMQHLTRLLKLRKTTISELMRDALVSHDLLGCGNTPEEGRSEPTP